MELDGPAMLGRLKGSRCLRDAYSCPFGLWHRWQVELRVAIRGTVRGLLIPLLLLLNSAAGRPLEALIITLLCGLKLGQKISPPSSLVDAVVADSFRSSLELVALPRTLKARSWHERAAQARSLAIVGWPARLHGRRLLLTEAA